MTILTQLHEQRGQIVSDARKILDDIKDDTPESEVTQLEERHDAKIKELDALDARIAREERQANAEKAEEERRAKGRPNGDNGSTPAVDDDADEPTQEQRSSEYRSAFARYVCGHELSKEDRSVLRSGGIVASEERMQLTTPDGKGGYTVPTTLMNELVRVMKDWGPMMDESIVRSINTSSGNPMTIPTIDDTNVTPEPHTEGAAPTDDGGKDATFGQKTLGAFAFDTEWVKWSWELDEDSIFAMESLLASLLGERLARNGNAKLTVGTGSGEPNGIVTASSLGHTAAAAAAIASDEVYDLFHSVNAAYRRSPQCRWQFSDQTLAVLRKLKDGQGNYLWSMGDVRTDQPNTLLGKPYSINDDVPAIASGNRPIIFGDHSKYFRRQVGSVRTVVVREKFAPDMGILGLARFDGELVDTNAVKHLAMA